jgi:hypothetical protein
VFDGAVDVVVVVTVNSGFLLKIWE